MTSVAGAASNYILWGLNNVEGKFLRGSFPTDSISPLNRSNSTTQGYSFEGKAVFNDSGPHLKYLSIDNSIQVTTVLDSIRAEGQNFWKERKVDAFNLMKAGGATGALGVAAWMCSIQFLPTILAITAVGILALSLMRNHTANNQLKSWEDPVEKVCQARKLINAVGDEAFKICYDNNYHKLSYITSNELKGLWDKWSVFFMNKYKTGVAARSEEIKNFFAFNPLDKGILTKSFGALTNYFNNDFLLLCDRFGAVKAHFDDMQAEIQKDKKRIMNYANEQITSLNNGFELNTSQFVENRKKMIDALPKESSSQANALETRRKQELSMIEYAYNTAMAPHQEYLRAQTVRVNQWKNDQIDQIERTGKESINKYGDWVAYFVVAFSNHTCPVPAEINFGYAQTQYPVYHYAPEYTVPVNDNKVDANIWKGMFDNFAN